MYPLYRAAALNHLFCTSGFPSRLHRDETNKQRKREKKKGRRPSTMLSVTLARRLQLAHASVLFTLNAKKDSATLDEKRSKSSLCTVEQLYNKASVTIHKRANSSHEDLNSQPARGLKNNSNNGSICKEENS